MRNIICLLLLVILTNPSSAQQIRKDDFNLTKTKSHMSFDELFTTAYSAKKTFIIARLVKDEDINKYEKIALDKGFLFGVADNSDNRVTPGIGEYKFTDGMYMVTQLVTIPSQVPDTQNWKWDSIRKVWCSPFG